MEVECKVEVSTGQVTSTKTTSLTEQVTYTECVALGTFVAEISVPKLELQSESPVSWLNTMTIKVPALGCSITIASKGNHELKGATYKNLAGGKLEMVVAVKGITYTSSGGLCGSSGTSGEYTDKAQVELVGGTIEWV